MFVRGLKDLVIGFERLRSEVCAMILFKALDDQSGMAR